MKHSKHLTVFISLLLSLLVVGIMFYVYLALNNPTQPVVVETEVAELDADQAEMSPAEVRARLEALRPTMSDATPEESEAIKERLRSVREADADLTPEEQVANEAAIKARLELLRSE